MTAPLPADATVSAPMLSKRDVQPAQRNPAIDLTKGALVVLMFVYHSINYFVPDKDVLRYLHFLPSSFIFIAGYLITFVQHAKYKRGDPHVRRRLLIRGLKLFGIFVALNLAAHSVFTASYNMRRFGLDVFIADLDVIFISGGQRAAVFDVLLPISYLLMLSSILLVRSRFAQVALLAGLAGASVAACVVLMWYGLLVFNLELLSMGVLGMAVGLLPFRVISGAVRSPMILVIANVLYAALVSYRYPVYSINVAGVLLTLLMLYAFGFHAETTGFVYRWLVLLGRYSLIGYIAQIAVLQVLFRVGGRLGFAPTFSVAVVTTAIATTAIVALLDRARTKSRAADASYRFLFA